MMIDEVNRTNNPQERIDVDLKIKPPQKTHSEPIKPVQRESKCISPWKDKQRFIEEK